MESWRRHAVAIAALTLALQVGLIAAASTALCCGPSHANMADDEMACCKESGGRPHACPIKKKPKPDVPLLKACCDIDQQALAALFGLSGPPEIPYTLLADVTDAPVAALAEQPLALVHPPDSPPPRS
jgi:hypothetical protein